MNREEIIAGIEEKKAHLKKRLETRERLMHEIDAFEEEIARLEDQLDEDFTEYEQLWADMRRRDELDEDIARRKEELVYHDSHKYNKWRRFIKRKMYGNERTDQS